MKTFKAGDGLAKWIMRIAVMGIAYASFFNTFMFFNMASLAFYISAAFIIFSVLLFAGGFSGNNSLTALSGLFVFLLSLLEIILIVRGNGISGKVLNTYLPLASIGLFFWSNGNK